MEKIVNRAKRGKKILEIIEEQPKFPNFEKIEHRAILVIILATNRATGQKQCYKQLNRGGYYSFPHGTYWSPCLSCFDEIVVSH